MSYQDDLNRHLAGFKQQNLGISEPGVYHYRGREVLYHHILPLAKASANLLEEAESVASAFLAANPGKRNQYFHHLNSSQAFAFNLFVPYFAGEPASATALLSELLVRTGFSLIGNLRLCPTHRKGRTWMLCGPRPMGCGRSVK